MATPLHIEIMTTANCSSVTLREFLRKSDQHKKYADELWQAGLLRECSDGDGGHFYEITDGGRMYIEMLESVPYPVQRWMKP